MLENRRKIDFESEENINDKTQQKGNDDKTQNIKDSASTQAEPEYFEEGIMKMEKSEFKPLVESEQYEDDKPSIEMAAAECQPQNASNECDSRLKESLKMRRKALYEAMEKEDNMDKKLKRRRRKLRVEHLCFECEKSYGDLEVLFYHIWREHFLEEHEGACRLDAEARGLSFMNLFADPVVCQFCNNIYSRLEIKAHCLFRHADEGPLKCHWSWCDKELGDFKTFFQHTRMCKIQHKNENPRPRYDIELNDDKIIRERASASKEKENNSSASNLDTKRTPQKDYYIQHYDTMLW